MTGVKARVKAVLLVRSEPGTGRFAKSPKRKESVGFSKNIKKLGLLTIGDKGLVLVSGLMIIASILEGF
jgi:hypothetical protein